MLHLVPAASLQLPTNFEVLFIHLPAPGSVHLMMDYFQQAILTSALHCVPKKMIIFIFFE